MVNKPKSEIDTKKIFEKLMIDVSKSINDTDKKENKKIKKDLPVEKKEDRVQEKVEIKKLEEAVVDNKNPGVDLKNLGLIRTNSPNEGVALERKLDNVANNVASDSKNKNEDSTTYARVNENYSPQVMEHQVKERKKNEHNQQIHRELQNRHEIENQIFRSQAPLKSIGMVKNPELQHESRQGYEPYQTSRVDSTPKKPWETSEDRIKKYK